MDSAYVPCDGIRFIEKWLKIMVVVSLKHWQDISSIEKPIREPNRETYQFSCFLPVTFLFDSVCVDVWIEPCLVNDSQNLTEIDLFA